MTNPTNEQWVRAWADIYSFVYEKHLKGKAKDKTKIPVIATFDILARFYHCDPRNHRNSNGDRANGMSLPEIMAKAKPGDEFICPGRTQPLGMDKNGFLTCSTGDIGKLNAYILNRKDWYFVKRYKCCPECGQLLEDE